MFSAGYRKYARYAMRPHEDMPTMPTLFIQNIYSPQFLAMFYSYILQKVCLLCHSSKRFLSSTFSTTSSNCPNANWPCVPLHIIFLLLFLFIFLYSLYFDSKFEAFKCSKDLSKSSSTFSSLLKLEPIYRKVLSRFDIFLPSDCKTNEKLLAKLCFFAQKMH